MNELFQQQCLHKIPPILSILHCYLWVKHAWESALGMLSMHGVFLMFSNVLAALLTHLTSKNSG